MRESNFKVHPLRCWICLIFRRFLFFVTKGIMFFVPAILWPYSIWVTSIRPCLDGLASLLCLANSFCVCLQLINYSETGGLGMISDQSSDKKNKNSSALSPIDKASAPSNSCWFNMPKFESKTKSFFGGLGAIETRIKTLQDYMNGLISLNRDLKLKQLLTCPPFDEFIDLISKFAPKLHFWKPWEK